MSPAAPVEDFFHIEGMREVKFKSREKLISMRIDVFLALAEDGHDPDKEAFVEELMRSGVRFSDVPCLLVNHDGDIARVNGHEGRHRARALAAAGYSHMPVNLIVSPGESGYSIRWSEQYDPARFDYAPIWPSVLKAEYGALPTPEGDVFQIPFPVSREDADAPYEPAADPQGCDQTLDSKSTHHALRMG